MRILHTIYDDVRNPWCGGGGALRVKRVNEYLSSSNQITVLTGNFPGAQNETIQGVEYRRVGCKSSYLLSRVSFAMLIPFHMKRFKSDIVINDCSFFAPCFADLYTERPVVNVIHHLMGGHAFRIYTLFGFLPFVFERIFLRISKNVITSAKSIREDIYERYPGKRIINIANGISDVLFHLEPEEEDFILFLGRIDVYMKGLDILLESFSRIRNKAVSLKIAGSGKKADVKRLVKLISDNGLEERVKFLGRVSETDKLELLRTCLFLVMPSRFEGWGITALEANAAGKPVLGTKINGMSEAVVDRKTAILIPPEDIEQLKETIDYLINNDDVRAKLGGEGRAWVKQYSWDSIAKQQYNFYESMLESENEKEIRCSGLISSG